MELSTASRVALQQRDICYNDIFSPVGDKAILRLVVTLALHLGY